MEKSEVIKKKKREISITQYRFTVRLKSSEIDCIGRIESFWPKFVRGWKVFWQVSL